MKRETERGDGRRGRGRDQKVETRLLVLEDVIAQWSPAVNEILFLRTTSPLTGIAIVRMKMCRTVGDGILQGHMTFKALMEVAGLGDVDCRPIAVRQFPGIDVNPGQWSQDSMERVYLKLVILTGLSRP